MNERLIYHFTEQDTFDRSRLQDEYIPIRFEKDGFIHCSRREQVLHIANGIAPRDTPLVLLEIDTTKIPHQIVYENLEGGDRLFPHIYGGIPLDAVTRVWLFKPDSTGVFGWPSDVDAIA